MKILHNHTPRKLTITEKNGRINVMNEKELNEYAYYNRPSKADSALIIFYGFLIFICLLLGYGIINIF